MVVGSIPRNKNIQPKLKRHRKSICCIINKNLENMKKEHLKEQLYEASSNICHTWNVLLDIQRQFNPELTDDDGKSVQAEYYALRDAIASIK
jgi:uncharacterized protein (DUF362 family)